MRVPAVRLLPLLVLLWATPVAAQDQRAFLDLVVNGVAKGETLVVMRGEDALVGVAALTEAGLNGFAGGREPIDNEPFVSLASLAPAVTFTLAEADLRLSITVDPSLLGAIVRDMGAGEPAGIQYRSARSLALNYAVTSSGREYDVFTESSLRAAGGLLSTTISMSPRGATRGVTSFTFDDRPRLRRWVVGETYVGGTALGGNVLLNGVTISREFSLAPYLVHHPTLSMSTPISAPSTVEVHVNGRLVREERVQPGLLDLKNLPLTSGRNDTRIVVRDPFGATRELSTSYYLTTSVLAPGVHDYQYSFGWRRLDVSRTSWDYAEPAFFARHRLGLTDWLSAGFRAEASRGVANGGPLLTLRAPVGEVEATAAVSRVDGGAGAAGQLSWSYGSRLASFGASLRETTAGYTNIGASLQSQAQRQVSAFASMPLGHGASLSVQHSRALGQIESDARTSLSESMRLVGSANLSASVSRFMTAGRPDFEASVGVTISMGSRGVTSINSVRGPEGTQMLVDVQQAAPVGTGFGYQLRGESGMRNAASGVLQYKGPYGYYELRHDAVGRHTSVHAAGALVGIGGGVYAARPLRNSFALVRVPGVDGVRAYASHLEIGRTGRGGNLLIPDLLPYYANELNIDDADIPLEYTVGKVNLALAPPYHGGAVALFPVQRIQRVSGALVLSTARGNEAPAFGDLTVVVAAGRLESPLGNSGEFYFENLPAGRHQASVTHDGRSCAFMLDVPRSNETALNLGTITCTVTAR
jgi:outer membrane usher protein